VTFGRGEQFLVADDSGREGIFHESPVYISGAWGNGGGRENTGRIGLSGEF